MTPAFLRRLFVILMAPICLTASCLWLLPGMIVGAAVYIARGRGGCEIAIAPMLLMDKLVDWAEM